MIDLKWVPSHFGVFVFRDLFLKSVTAWGVWRCFRFRVQGLRRRICSWWSTSRTRRTASRRSISVRSLNFGCSFFGYQRGVLGNCSSVVFGVLRRFEFGIAVVVEHCGFLWNDSLLFWNLLTDVSLESRLLFYFVGFCETLVRCFGVSIVCFVLLVCLKCLFVVFEYLTDLSSFVLDVSFLSIGMAVLLIGNVFL